MNIIAKIVSGAVTLWTDIVNEIEGDAAKVKAALPASAIPAFDVTVSDLKQGASDALSAVTAGATSVAPGLVKGLEALADQELAVATNGLAVPLVPLVNTGIDNIAAAGIASLKAWALKAKASLAAPAK